MDTLYALKPWYAGRLTPVTDRLDALHVRPNAVTLAGIAAAALGGCALTAPSGVAPALAVLACVAVRLACANMDGTLARRRPPSRFGAVVNELGDRGADLALLAGLWPHLGPVTGLVLLAATLPSWSALAVAAAGGTRRNGGPVGKTERCALVVLAALTGWYVPVAVAIGVGGALTALARLAAGRRELSA